MYQPGNQFVNAYQDELLRTSQRLQSRSHKVKHTMSLTEHLTDRLGDAFIALGERLKGKSTSPCLEIPCPEMARGRA